MSYKKPKLTDKRKLCPRCGAPMMSKSETVKYCPLCYFSESTKKPMIKIKIEDKKEEEEKSLKIELFRVTSSDVTKASSLESEYAYVVVDPISNILWIWKGSRCRPGEAYKAGVQTTILKSSLKMYNANIIQVEEGDEPENFPIIEEGLRETRETKLEGEEEQKHFEVVKQKSEEAEEQNSLKVEEQKVGEEERDSQETEQDSKEEEVVDAWHKVAKNTEPTEELEKSGGDAEDEELNQVISSLTLVKGINEELAKKLYNAEIISIMGLSLSNPEELAAKIGTESSVIQNLIENAKELLGLD